MSSSQPAPQPIEATLPKGPLLKRRRTLSWFKYNAWQERQVQLEEENLVYYKPKDQAKKKSPKHRRAVSLEGCTVQALQDKDKPGRCPFEVRHPRRKSLTLAAESAEQRDAWVTALNDLVEREAEGGEDGAGVPSSIKYKVEADGGLVPSQLRGRHSEASKLVMEEVLKEEGWALQFDKKGVKGYRRVLGGFTATKGVGVVGHHPVSILLAVMDYALALQADPDLDECKRVEVHNSHTFLDYFVYKGVWPVVAPRDMYIANTWEVLPNGDIAFISYSEPEGGHPEAKGNVRAFCIAAAWLIHPLDASGTKCEVTYFAMVDLKGNIPKALVDKVNEDQPLEVATMDDLLKKHQKDYLVDLDLAKLTQQAVATFVHQLHRRTIPDWQQYDWLKGGEGKSVAVAGTTTTAKVVPPPDVVMSDEGPFSTAGMLVKKTSPQQGFTLTAFILLVIAAIQFRMQV